MAKLLSRIISYGASFAVIFHALNPQSPIVSHFDNLYILYNIISTVGFVFAAFIVLILAVGNSKMSGSDVVGEEREKFNKAMKSFDEEMKKNKALIFLSSVLGIVCGLTAFIVLSEHYMGFLMMSSIFLFSMIRSQMKDMGKKIKEQNA